MTITMKISLFDINHLNTMIRENKAEKNNVVNEQETIQNNMIVDIAGQPLKKISLIAYKLSIFYIHTT